jgi:hypothetical protein
MPRCNDCNKFVSLDTDVEPEETSSTLSFSGDESTGITADYDVDIRIVNNCADCGTELKDADLNVSGSFDLDASEYEQEYRDQWYIEVEGLSRTERGGAGRYDKKYYGFEGTVVLKDGNGEELERTEVSEDEQASGMNDLQ